MAEAQQNHVRPTEAQLRWAGFHSKKRASSVKIAVENFYLQPPNVKDVEGAPSNSTMTRATTAKPGLSSSSYSFAQVESKWQSEGDGPREKGMEQGCGVESVTKHQKPTMMKELLHWFLAFCYRLGSTALSKII